MDYLGEQTEAKEIYSMMVSCWLRIKFLGKYSSKNKMGHKCDQTNCSVCSRDFRKSEKFAQFSNFFVPFLEAIITSSPKELQDVYDKILKEWKNVGLGNKKNFDKKCSELFKEKGYKEWFTSYSINYELANLLDRHTCTYCNRQYIFVARESEEAKGLICQFDHWYDKATYPLLALSFYNLIPSCSVCNSSALKGSKHFNTNNHIHPYIDKNIMEKYHFTYKKNTFSENEIRVKSLEPKEPRIQKTIDDLNLDLVYKNHSSKELKDLIDLRKKYSENYLEILLEKTFDKKISVTKEEKYRLIFGVEINEDKMHKRIFSKFKSDIISELLLVKN